MEKPRHVLVVGARDHTLTRLEKLGVRYSLFERPGLITGHALGGAHRLIGIDYRNLVELLDMAKTIHRLDPFDAVISFTEYGLEPASLCARELGVAGDNTAAVALTRDKVMMRRCLAEAGVSTVRFAMCRAFADAQVFFENLGGKAMVLKPSDGGASIGVSFVDQAESLQSAWAWSRSASSGTIIAEEYLDGPEYSVESISHNGQHEILVITEKVTTGAPHFIESGHQLPASLPQDTATAINVLVAAFLVVIGHQTGPAHTEVIVGEHGARIVESQTRVGGDQIWEMTQIVNGVDQMTETICLLLGLPLPRRESIASAAAIRFFAYEHARVISVDGLEEAQLAPGVVRVESTLNPGQVLGKLKSSVSRQGYVLAIGETAAVAAAHAEAGMNLVRIRCELREPDTDSAVNGAVELT